MTDDSRHLSDELVAYYREVLATHGFVDGASVCRVCGVSRCPDWIAAYDALAAAGRAMTAEPIWEPYVARNPR
jgi:hypothetical protein